MDFSKFFTRVVLILVVFDRGAVLGPKFVESSGTKPLDVVFFMEETEWVRGFDKYSLIEWLKENAFGFDIGLGEGQTRVGLVRCYRPKIDHLNRETMSNNEIIQTLQRGIDDNEHWQHGSDKIHRCFRVVTDMFQEKYGDRPTAPNIAIGLVYPEYPSDQLDAMKGSFIQLKERTSLILMVALRKFGTSGSISAWFAKWETNYNEPMKHFMASVYNNDKYYIVRSTSAEVPPAVKQLIQEAFPKDVQDCVIDKHPTTCKLEDNVCQRRVETVIAYTPDPDGKPCPTVRSGTEECDDLMCCENHQWTIVVVPCSDPCNSSAVEKVRRPETDILEVEKKCELEKDRSCFSQVKCDEIKKQKAGSDDTVTIVVAVIGCIVFVIVCIIIIVVFIRSRKGKKKPIKKWKPTESSTSPTVTLTAEQKKPNKKRNSSESESMKSSTSRTRSNITDQKKPKHKKHPTRKK